MKFRKKPIPKQRNGNKDAVSSIDLIQCLPAGRPQTCRILHNKFEIPLLTRTDSKHPVFQIMICDIGTSRKVKLKCPAPHTEIPVNCILMHYDISRHFWRQLQCQKNGEGSSCYDAIPDYKNKAARDSSNLIIRHRSQGTGRGNRTFTIITRVESSTHISWNEGSQSIANNKCSDNSPSPAKNTNSTHQNLNHPLPTSNSDNLKVHYIVCTYPPREVKVISIHIQVFSRD